MGGNLSGVAKAKSGTVSETGGVVSITTGFAPKRLILHRSSNLRVVIFDSTVTTATYRNIVGAGIGDMDVTNSACTYSVVGNVVTVSGLPNEAATYNYLVTG